MFSGLQAPPPGSALAPFRHVRASPSEGGAQVPNADLELSVNVGQTPHVVGRPAAAMIAKEGQVPATPKPHGAPRTPVKQLPKAPPTKSVSEAGAQARQQLLEAKRAAPPTPEGGPLPASPGSRAQYCFADSAPIPVLLDTRRWGGGCATQSGVRQDGVTVLAKFDGSFS